MSKETRSPLKGKPLRNPGQSVDEELEEQIYDHVLAPFLIAVFGLALAGMEWWTYYHPRPPTPILYSVLALITVAYAVFKI